ncbi:MAG: hypothetical protein KBT11_06535 [Treponema sp.]|nr:hypothetical protein [Candidatus Treponema equifaecale]
MKKTLFKVAGLLTIASSLFLASCGDNGDEYNSAVDTVYTLDTPSVTAKAYPGVTFVSWMPVSGANGYKLSIYEDGKFVSSPSITGNKYVHSNNTSLNLKNGVSYTYYVEAVSVSNPGTASREVYAKNSAQGSASATAIVPPIGTRALELAAYEGGYDGKTSKTLSADEQKLSLADTLEVVGNAKDELDVSFNSKAYLNYTLYLEKGNNYETTKVHGTRSTSLSDNNVNNKTAYAKFTLTSSGDYKVYAEAKSPNTNFSFSEEVASKKVTVASLGVAAATGVAVAYIDDGKTARVSFTPASFTDGTKATTDMYKVYKAVAGTSELTAVSGTVAKTTSDAKYFVDDTVADNTKNYVYTVVLTDGTAYGTTAPTADLAAYALSTTASFTVSASATTLDTDGIANDITWTVTKTAKQTVKAYLLKKDASYTGTPVAADFDTTTALEAADTTNTNGTSVVYYTKNIEVGTAYLLVVASEEGKKDRYVIKSQTVAAVGTPSAPTLAVSVIDNTLTEATPAATVAVLNDVEISVSDNITLKTDSIENYTFTLYRAKATLKSDSASVTFDIESNAKWEKVSDVEMKSDEAYDPSQTTVTYKGFVEQANTEDGVYAYKVVKTNKAGLNSSSTIRYVTVDTVVAGANYRPVLSASFATPTEAKSSVEITWTKNIQTLTAVMGTGDLAGKEVDYKNEETSQNVKYTLYKATLVDSKTKVVYTKVDISVAPKNNKVTRPVYKLVDGVVTPDTKDYVDSIEYTFTVTELSTGESYLFIVVAENTDAEPQISLPVTVSGAN